MLGNPRSRFRFRTSIELDPDSAEVERQHRQGLAEQLGSRPERPRIVDEADDEDDQPGDQHRRVMLSSEFADGLMPEWLVQERQDRSGRNAHRQRQPPQPGDRALMNSTKLVGPIDGADPCGDPGHKRRGQHAARHGHREDRQVQVGNHGPDQSSVTRTGAMRSQESISGEHPGCRSMSRAAKSVKAD